MKSLLMFACLLISYLGNAAQIPQWAKSDFERKGLNDYYEFSDYLKPSFIEVDLNGDMKNDIALLVTEKKSGKKGIIILHQDDPNTFILGAGTSFGDGGNDFSQMQEWRKMSDVAVRPNERIRNGIEVIFSDKSPAVIIFDGKGYNWRIQEG